MEDWKFGVLNKRKRYIEEDEDNMSEEWHEKMDLHEHMWWQEAEIEEENICGLSWELVFVVVECRLVLPRFE